MAVLSNIKKINTKYWIVFAVEPFKKRCDNFDAEFILSYKKQEANVIFVSKELYDLVF